MASSYTRKITLFINGKEVKNDVASISAELRKLQNELKRTTIGSQEYQAKLAEFNRVKGYLAEHTQAIKGTQSTIGKLKDTAAGLLPAFGWAAIATGAAAAFKKIISSTDTLSTQWEIFTGGLRSGMNEFWRTIASGDWSNFTSNMKEAVRVGREYASMMDEIEEKSRALSIAEADSRSKELELEVKLKNKGLTDQQRIEAGQERIRIEEELAASRVKVAQEAYDAELMLATQQSRLSKEKLMEVVRDMDSDLKTKAEAYNKLKAQVKGLEAVNKPTYTGPGTVSMPSPEIGEKIKSLQAEMLSYPDSVKTYADALSGVGNVTDEQLNKLVESYSKLKQAQDSAVENTKKTRTTVNNLLAETRKDQEDEAKKAAEAQKKIREDAFNEGQKALEGNYNQELNILKERLMDGSITQKQYNREEYILLLSHLGLMKQLYEKFAQDTTAIQAKIIDNKLKLQSELSELMKPYEEVSADLAKSDLAMYQQIDAEMAAHMAAYKEELDKQAEDTIEAEEKKKKAIEATREAQIRSAVAAGDAAVENATTFEEAGKAVLNSIRQQLRAYMAEAVATAALKALKSVPFPINIIAATAAGGAATLLFNKLIPKFSEGGYTGSGAKDEPAGIVHKGEYIVPAHVVKNPQVAPILATLENLRQKKIEVNPAIMTIPGFRDGGFAGARNATESPSPATIVTTDPELKELIRQNIAASEANRQAAEKLMRWQPKVSSELIRRDIQTLEDIERNSGL